MFTWICPQCGREVPPSYNECPDCVERAKGAVTPQQPAAPATPPPPSQPAPAAAPPAQPQYVYVQKQGQHGWLVALLVALGLVAVGAGAYYYLLPSARAHRGAGAESAAALETPQTPAAQSGPAARTARFLEVTGLRIVEESKRAQIRFLVVNHSAADLAAVKGSVVLHASNAQPGSPPIATLPLDVATLGPYEVKEIIAPLKTSLRAYELPDWQFLKADLQLTSP